ncbi:integrase catalytic domain-containing protein [Trichonephila clavipes]|nr:integrase catalytic domain-containing protein [Trichonephila clavipes]
MKSKWNSTRKSKICPVRVSLTLKNVLSGVLFHQELQITEAGVKAVKYHLRRVMGNLRFTYEQLLTTLNQIEGVLNSRPLYPLSCDPHDFDALTPGHFLVGRPITAIAEPNLIEVSDDGLKVRQIKQKLCNRFGNVGQIII